MTSQRRRRGQQQQRLKFEPIPNFNSPGQEGLSPARVKFQSPNEASSPSSLAVRPLRMGRPKKPRQQTLETSLANSKTATPSVQKSLGGDEDAEMLPFSIGNDVQVRRRQESSPPASSFMSRSKKPPRHVVDSDSDTPVEDDVGIDVSHGEGPPRHEVARRSLRRPSRNQQSDASDMPSSQSLPNLAASSDDDSDDAPLVTPRSSVRRKKSRRAVEEEDDDDDDVVVASTPAKRRRLGGKARQETSVIISDDSDSPPGRSRGQTTPENQASAGPESARKTRSSARKGHRSEKEKRMELLRRRRAGEKNLTMSDLEAEEDEEEGDRGALYDTDSDHQALDHFEDESELEAEQPITNESKKKGRLSKKQSVKDRDGNGGEDTENSDGNLASFIDDDDDTIGVPEEALYHMPLQFTRASRKPLKAHFRDAVEWLIHRRISPAFERDDEVYKTAWTRLNDEVMGLANSKFISSVWRPDFYRVLRARPYIETVELGYGHLATEFEKCEACGRSNHPATWAIQFKGKALPPEDKQFFVGTVCNSNAETAHNLLHWKPALRDWVDQFLENGGWLTPAKLAEREKMKAKKRRKLADDIVEDCDQRDIIKRLYADFKHNIELAQTKDTTKSSRGGRRYGR
ncbi:hypothetical protein VPNG_05967 [Cytospora leucostoma]|uniref:DUF4211 domain-containing protein n=1 Tax=Cytospora leucostoma TaxID=1230097 RepID=A0A423XAQ3_9PEZI|nr:hypothetical protein VPNG_05967 [Cytospora leucostoma]